MVLLNRPHPVDPEIDPLDSLLDLLNRDQRTTITIDRKSRCGVASSRRGDFGGLSFENSKSLESSYGFNNKIKSRSRGSRLSASIPRLACRLGEVFIVGVCLLTVVRVPTVMSAPSTRHGKPAEQIHFHKPTEDTLSYLYPCGKNHEKEMNSTYYNVASKGSNPDILKHIIIQTKNALDYAESFRDRYVEKTFHSPFDKHHARWASQKYDWLPNEVDEIPKRLGKAVSCIHLKSKSVDDFLINIYEYLQKYAVALEQVVADQKKMHGEFRENFEKLENYLQHVRCVILEAMMVRNIAPRGQVPRSIMKDDVRQLEQASFRNVRDWFIFRDLMNSLEYVIQVFSFIDEHTPQSSASTSS